MNIALVLQHKLLLGIQRFISGTPSPSKRAPYWATNPAEFVQAPRMAVAHRSEVSDAPAVSIQAKKVMPLRVLWVLEKGQPRSCTGRMVISGRMADVCAELDRLVAREAALH
jgi:hypothetical protein